MLREFTHFVFFFYVPGIIVSFLKIGQIHDGEGNKLCVEDNILQMLVEKEAVGDADFAKGLGPGYFRADAGSLLPLGRVPHPVVPIAAGPLRPDLFPQV